MMEGRPKWTMGDCMGQKEVDKKENMANPVIIYVCKNHDYVVVDVQFQGRETDYDIIQEQFEFELVGNRIQVRPCAADHPQVAGYPRTRPASPRNEPIGLSRAKSKSQELQSRSARSKSRSPSPTRSQLLAKQTLRDRSTSPCFSRKMPQEDSEERYPPNRRRAHRGNVRRDDSYTNFSTPRVVRPQPRQMRKEASMWNISKKGSDNDSIESSASLGDVNCGPSQYCLQQDINGSYTFTGRPKNIDRMKRGRRNLAVQAGYDEDLRYKRLKQFSNGRKKYDTYQRNKPIGREVARSRYNSHDFDFNDEEPKRNKRQYRNRETKKCMYSCQPCCSNEIPPAVLFEECEMFASSETIRYEADKYEKDEEDEEEDFEKNNENKNADKGKMKPSKRNPHNPTSSLLSVNLKPQASREKFKPEEDEELEVKESKYKEQKQNKKDKDRNEDRQKSKKDKTKTVVIKTEDSDDDENEEEVPSKALIAQSKNRLSPERAKKKEEKEDRKSAQSRNKRSPERAKKREESSQQSKNRSSPESKKVKEEKKIIKQTNLAMTRNCCRKALLLYKRAHFEDDDKKEE